MPSRSPFLALGITAREGRTSIRILVPGGGGSVGRAGRGEDTIRILNGMWGRYPILILAYDKNVA